MKDPDFDQTNRPMLFSDSQLKMILNFLTIVLACAVVVLIAYMFPEQFGELLGVAGLIVIMLFFMLLS